MKWEIIESSNEVVEYTDNTLGDFNKTQDRIKNYYLKK